MKKILMMMMAFATLLVLFGMLAGCLGIPGENEDTKKNNNGGDTVYSDSVLEVNNRFAFELYAQLCKEHPGENVFFSPWSVTVALGMTYEGARGNTAKQMEDVLHIPSNDTERWNSFRSMQSEINGASNDYELHSANSYWGDDEIRFNEDFLDILTDQYLAEAGTLDLNGDPVGSTDTINEWVENETDGRIEDLLDPTDFDANTALVLTNAVYFKAEWKYMFDAANTTGSDFCRSDGNTVTADMMRMLDSDETFDYYENEDLQALALPYAGNELSMIVVLPKGDDISALDDYLSSDDMERIMDGMSGEKVDILLPRFELEQNYKLEETLPDMGMPDAFHNGADFSGMTEIDYGLFIDQINHKAFVEVNEAGTEAAAATAVIMTYNSTEPEPRPQFNADHPFLFFIRQNDNGNILFLGTVADPTV